MDGPLPTDRPHVLGGVGYYSLKWLGMETNFGVTQIVASGSPKSSCFSTIQSGSSCQFFDQRGTWVDVTRAANGDWVPGTIHHDARTPWYTQTDLNFTHSFKVSKDHEGMRLAFEWNVLNALNQAAVLSYSPLPTAGSQSFLLPDSTNNGSGVNFQQLMTGWNPFAAANATAYGVTTPLTLNGRYGLPFLFQTRRTMRMAIKFTF